jgi:hypothetical protein
MLKFLKKLAGRKEPPEPPEREKLKTLGKRSPFVRPGG